MVVSNQNEIELELLTAIRELRKHVNGSCDSFIEISYKLNKIVDNCVKQVQEEEFYDDL